MPFHRQAIMLNAVLTAALFAVMFGAVGRFAPQWNPVPVLIVCFLIALEAGIVHRTFRRERMWAAELMRYLVPELLVMAVAMRVAVSLSLPANVTFWETARRWLYDPVSVFDSAYVVALVLGVIVGLLAHVAMEDLLELAPRRFDRPVTNDEEQRSAAMAADERSAALRRINRRFLTGGMVVLCCLALEAVNIDRIGGPSHPISWLSGVSALAYLISGFLLHSQGRLALLQSRWRLEGAAVAQDVERRWNRSNWLIVVGVGVAMLALPRTYALGLLDTIAHTLGYLGYVIAVVGYSVIWLFSLLLLVPAYLVSLLFPPVGQTTAPPPEVPQLAPPPQAPPAEPRLLTALIFWMCMLALIGYATMLVAQRHPGVVAAVTSRGPLGWLRRLLGGWWREGRALARQVGHVMQERWAQLRPQPAARRSLINLRRLAPRELIIYFYTSTLRRAAQRGVPRPPAQTPYEYRETLAAQLPEAEQDVAELTEAFVEARYAPVDPGPADAERARRPWERMRQLLRRRAN